MNARFYCELCPGRPAYPVGEVEDHLRLLHPDDYGNGFEHWPDGGLVVVDLTLQPADFVGGAA